MFCSWLSKRQTLNTKLNYIKQKRWQEGAPSHIQIKQNYLIKSYFLHFIVSLGLNKTLQDSLIRFAYVHDYCRARLFCMQHFAARGVLVPKMQKLPIKWVKLDKFCEQTGFTRKSVYALIRNGRWMISKHFTKRGRRLFINVVEYERWVEEG